MASFPSNVQQTTCTLIKLREFHGLSALGKENAVYRSSMSLRLPRFGKLLLMDIVKTHLLPELLQLYPPHIQKVVADGMKDLLLAVAQLGVEVMRAERAELTYAEACKRPGDYPLMTRTHNGVVDLLQLEIGESERIFDRHKANASCRYSDPNG